MSKPITLMAETMKIPMQQMAMIQQQQQQSNGICLSTNASFSSLFSTTSTAKTNISYHKLCTSTKYNDYNTTNNVNECTTTHNECTLTNNELTKSCKKRNIFFFIKRLSIIILNLKFPVFFVLSYL